MTRAARSAALSSAQYKHAEWSKGLANISDALQGVYSRRLYGAPGLVDLSSMNFLWADLLPDIALDALNSAGVLDAPSACSGNCWHDFQRRQGPPLVTLFSIGTLYTRHSVFSEPMDAVWVNRMNVPVPSHGWVEVTHCSKIDQFKSTPGPLGPTWFYVARGSGLWLNVGSTFVVDEAALMSSHFVPQVSIAMKSFWKQNGSWLGHGLGKIDSVQRVRHHEDYNTLDHHEIALAPSPLLNEGKPLVAALNATWLQCGSWPQSLQRCLPTSPAVMMLERGCAGRPARLSKRVMQHIQPR